MVPVSEVRNHISGTALTVCFFASSVMKESRYMDWSPPSCRIAREEEEEDPLASPAGCHDPSSCAAAASSRCSAASCPLTPPLPFASCLPAGCCVTPVVAPLPPPPRDFASTSSLQSGSRNSQRPTCRATTTSCHLAASTLRLAASALRCAASAS